MDLAQPLSSLIPSVDADVLTVLARTEAPLTGRKIATLARRGSQPAVQAILDRLVKHGIAHAQPAGPSVLYTLNRDHLLAEAVLNAVGARATLLTRLCDDINQWPVPAIHSSLFGSTARGDARPDSDIDVLIVRPDDIAGDSPVWSAQLESLESRTLEWTGNHLAWFETDRAGLAKAMVDGEPLLDSLRADGIHLTGVPLASLTTPTKNTTGQQ
ncbi:nucleotidyltransferase domain-containing protein [Nocardioides speluncae]|uniref:nucleotidyltransferase domain-containing protein n=1 Tax=Nocardioides speluncae TaxID=2670337 RepID=UPI000D690099|nr:nucleotidyltransferase domain-containing protein [Nocardioides speluncae]